MDNYIRRYVEEIRSGRITVCKKIKIVYERLMDIVEDKDPIWYYNETKGNKIIKFAETFCKQSKGKWARKPLKLLLFQKAKLQAIFGILNRETDLRKFKEVFDVRARKNGKSVENSAISLYLLLMDGEHGAEIYCAATVMAQSKRVWEESKNMVEQSADLSKYIRSRLFPTTELYVKQTMSTYKPLSKNIETFDGLNSSAAIIDEIHALARKIYDILKQSMSTREQPLLSMITTAGFIREGLFDDMYNYATKVIEGSVENESFFPLIYELDSEDEMYEESYWIKANPAIDIIKNRTELRENVERSKHDKNFANTVKVKDFNIIGVEHKAWLEFNVFNKQAVYNLNYFYGGIAIGGFDLSRTNDLTAFSTLFYHPEDKKFVFETMYWMPTAKYNEMIDSKIPYRQWVDRGLIRLCPGNSIDYRMIADYVYQEMAIDRNITYLKIHYDAYSAIYLVKELESMGFSDRCLIRTQQGFKTLSIPMQTLESHMKDDLVAYQNNPVTKWCLSNVELVQDRNGNYMPKKPDVGVERKIDGAATMINCYVGLVENYEGWISNYE